MDFGNLLNYYNTLFGIEIAIFGIISAVILVFIQLVYSNYSYRHISHILTNRWLIMYFVFSTVDLLITAAGSYFLSLGRHDIIPSIYFASDIIVSNQFYSLACLLLIFISIAFFITLIVKDITYLQPHRAIFLLLKNTSYDQIKNFLWKKYGLEPPYNLRIRFAGTILEDLKRPKETKKAREARLKRKYQEEDKELKRVESEIEVIKKKVENAEDPLLPIRDMMIQFVKRSDLSSLEESSILIGQITETFFKTLPKTTKQWKAEDVLAMKYTEHLIELLETVIEIADKEQLESAKRIVIESSHKIALRLFENGSFSELDKIEEFWQRVADNSIGKSTILFQNIIKYYQEIGEKLFKSLNDKASKPEDSQTIIENIFRYIGWLGERLLIKLPFEESPLFMNYEYSTEYDTYYNCLLSFSSIYDREQPKLYPLIYFDALYVVLKRLAQIYKKNKRSRLDENIFSLAYAFSSFAESAIQAENGRGASLAAVRIKESYDELKKEGLDEEANDVIKLLVRIGMLAAINKDKLQAADFMGKSLDMWVIEELVKSGEEISGEVSESYIKSMGGDHNKRWGFIVELGMRMGTNFGFMFDPADGKLYADDDPRRR